MTLQQARKQLEKIGFTFDTNHKTLEGSIRFGTCNSEKYDVSPNHFTPKFRHVWISSKNKHYDPVTLNRFHVSSSIKGVYRKYRSKNSFETDLGNIFGIGKTLEEAVNDFVSLLKSKTYNRS